MNDDVDEDNAYEVNMEKIMARFSNFNSVMSQKSDADDDDEEDEDTKHEDDRDDD